MSTLTISLPAAGFGPANRPRPAASVRSAPVRLTARGRSALALLMLLLAVGDLALLLPPAAAGVDPHAASANVAVRLTVDPGQTLWHIARSAAPEADPRTTIARIKEMNGLSSSALEAGQVLLVPVP